jgi:hypothetical protein
MKVNYKDLFLEERIEEAQTTLVTLAKTACAELGFDETDLDLLQNQDLFYQKIIELYMQDEDTNNILYQAVHDMDLNKIQEIKRDISTDLYLKNLMIPLLINVAMRNDDIVKFLITKTELAEWSELKTELINSYIFLDNESQWNEEIIQLLLSENEIGYKTYLTNAISICYDEAISDHFLIKICENISNINEVLVVKVSYDDCKTMFYQDQTLLDRAITTKRFVLAKWLVEQGADVNYSYHDRDNMSIPLYQHTLYYLIQNIEFFELLVNSGRLIKDNTMKNFLLVNFDNTNLKLSDLYDIFTWRYQIQDNLNHINQNLQNWLNNKEIHFVDNLFKALKPINIKISDLQDDILNNLYNKNAQGFIDDHSINKNKLISKHFIENWHENMLICKNLDFHNIFGIKELHNIIGFELFEIGDQIELTGVEEVLL